ncbi:hypothetical protein [Vreelandella venusta]|uniref:hypothetical protein n=1 Tax=Vreelandella venusta TaxID=44935 RepID=UPI0018DA9590|nr:hypothetical protein [Halomonas venusta]QPI64473.1 hypothetical protein IR195_01720 [Halomonas venusta]
MKLKINLSPCSGLAETSASIAGTVLTVNGTDYDLSELPDGAIAQHSELGEVTRNGDEYECTIRLGHGPNAQEATRFPQPIILENHNGDIELPVYDIVEEEPVDELVK